MKIVVIASLAWSLTNFRGRLLEAMVAAGHEVIACAPEADPDNRSELAAIGVAYRAIPMQRAATGPLADLATLRALVALLRETRPDVVLAYTQKPIIYGGLATRIVGGIAFHAMVSGLGHAFTDVAGWRRRLLRATVATLTRVGIRRAATVFVFNRDDAAEMRRHGMLAPHHQVVQVPGSGIDTGRFTPRPLPPGPPAFLLVARLLRNKGLAEFAAAAALLRQRYPEARFLILGPHDANPESIGRAELDAWVASGAVDYLGATRDVAPHLAAAHVFVLPSWYREGLPRTLLEAMASGRAVITTDMPGCREPVEVEGNGLLVPPRDATALAAAMARFLDDPGLAARMGARSRELALARYDVRRVNALLLATMGLAAPETPLPEELPPPAAARAA